METPSPCPPLIREVCCRCPPDKGDTPEGGRGFVFESLPPKGGVPRPASLSGRKPPLIPPYQGGQKALPLRASTSRRGEEVCCRCPPDKGDPPEGGRGFVFEALPPKGGVPRPASLSGRKPPLIPPYQGGKKLSPFGVALLPCREWNPPLNPPPYQGGLLPLSP